jgi:choline dehydrogenase-like flavoprotein
MISQRGNPLDYARWAASPGTESWDYAHRLPFFKRAILRATFTSTGVVYGVPGRL